MPLACYMPDLEDVDRQVFLDRKSVRPANVTNCIMNRDICNKNQFRYHSSSNNQYSNPYQLFESVLPTKSASIDLNQVDPLERGSRPQDLSVCLGFSPDGRYLVFQTHNRTKLTLCHYKGVEGVNPDSGKSFHLLERTSMFSSSEVYNLQLLQNYRPAPVKHSWWTDDSSTLIIVLKQEKRPSAPINRHAPNNPDVFARVNRTQESASRHWNYPDPEPEHRVRPRPHYTMENPPQLGDDSDPDMTFSDEEEDPSGSEPSNPEPRNEEAELDKMIACIQILHKELNHENLGMERNLEPFVKALFHMDNGYVPDPEEEGCSRTSNLYHNYIKAHNLDKQKPDHPPSATFEIWVRRHNNEPCHPPAECGYRRPIIPYPHVKRAHRWKHPKKFDPTGLFRQVREDTEVFSEGDFIDHKRSKDKRRVYLVVAYNFNTGKTAPLRVVNERGIFHVNMNNRRLTVVSNGDFIETFTLLRTSGAWEQVHPARLSTTSCIRCPIRYRTDTRPGFPVEYPTAVGCDPINSLYDMSAFHSPIVQDSKTLLYRDQLKWFIYYQNIRVDIPVVTRCHSISRSLMAVTITYLISKNKRPLHHGLVVDLNMDAVMLYPNYTEFLQILLKNHMADMFPRTYTYLSPHPVHLQDWFADLFVDVNDPHEMNHYSKMKSAYDLMYERLKNNRGFMNPLLDSKFYADDAVDFMSNYLYVKTDTSVNMGREWLTESPLAYTEKWFHPFDPMYIIKSLSLHFARIPAKAERDVFYKEEVDPATPPSSPIVLRAPARRRIPSYLDGLSDTSDEEVQVAQEQIIF